jgi:hypothetical protein
MLRVLNIDDVNVRRTNTDQRYMWLQFGMEFTYSDAAPSRIPFPGLFAF